MTVLRIDSSIQGPRSASSALADLVQAEVTSALPNQTIITRHLANQPLPADAWATAVTAGFTPAEERTPAQSAAVALSAGLTAELRSADALVLALPLYNWGVSQHVKTWIDLAIAGAPAGTPLLQGVPVVLLTTRGGGYTPGTPREGWDHNTGYLRQILGDVWGADLTVVERELTLVGVNPALDGLKDLGQEWHDRARREAIAAGRGLAERLKADAEIAA